MGRKFPKCDPCEVCAVRSAAAVIVGVVLSALLAAYGRQRRLRA